MTRDGAARTVLLLNPNSSAATTALMLDAAAPHLPPGLLLRGTQAAHGPGMIVDAAALAASAVEVVRIGTAARGVAAVVVAAFGDPGVARLRALLDIPVIGIGEAALREAAAAGRFGIATTTPGLLASIEAMVRALGLEPGFTGVRMAEGDPLALAADPARQAAALAEAAEACLHQDGAAAVVIGGGPLSGAAAALQGRFGPRLVAPVPAAMRQVARTLER